MFQGLCQKSLRVQAARCGWLCVRVVRKWSLFFYAMHSILFFAFCVTIHGLEEDPMTTYYRLYQYGVQFYNEKNFTVAKSLFEKALEDYHFYHQNAINCRVECRREKSNLVENLEESRKVLDILEINIFENFIHQSKCIKRCYKRVFGERPDHHHNSETKRIDKDFEDGRIFQYLQFSYYEVRENAFSREVTLVILQRSWLKSLSVPSIPELLFEINDKLTY